MTRLRVQFRLKRVGLVAGDQDIGRTAVVCVREEPHFDGDIELS